MNKKQKALFLAELAKVPGLSKWQIESIQIILLDITKPHRRENIIRAARSKSLITLSEWEGIQGCCLRRDMLDCWIKEKRLCPHLIQQMIEEFRTEMLSKNKQYADFRAAFQTYLTKGYLSKRIEQVLWENSPYKSTSSTQIFKRGMPI